MSESKREKFERLATARTKRVIKAIRILAGMGGPGRYKYEFSVDDVEQIAAALDAEVDELRRRMAPPGRQMDIEFDFLSLNALRQARREASAPAGTGTAAEALNASGGTGRPVSADFLGERDG